MFMHLYVFAAALIFAALSAPTDLLISSTDSETGLLHIAQNSKNASYADLRRRAVGTKKRKDGEDLDDEKARLNSLTPLQNTPNIMFWRPQKVGSSTILGILVSYGYRYNYFPRRKASMNSFCRKIATCLLKSENGSLSNAHINGKNEDQLRSFLREFKRGASPGSGPISFKPGDKVKENAANQIHFKTSLTHEICNMPRGLIEIGLPCAFDRKTEKIKEIFLVREPVSRAISVYYFWGELFKLKKVKKRSGARRGLMDIEEQNSFNHVGSGQASQYSGDTSSYDLEGRNLLDMQTMIFPKIYTKANPKPREREAIKFRLGKTVEDESAADSFEKTSDSSSKVIKGGTFVYHGDESTPPPAGIAMAYAKKLPYRRGMPGPSELSSAFGDKVSDAITAMSSTNMLTLVTERLDESLIALRHHLGWSIPDIIIVKPRKAYSSHPKVSDWPQGAVSVINRTLARIGETLIYKRANVLLDKALSALEARGISVQNELEMLKAIRSKVTDLCLQEKYLERYRKLLVSEGFHMHPSGSQNYLRDSEDRFAEGGHCFSLNRELMYSYDICGACESHAIFLSVQKGISIDDAPLLEQMNKKSVAGNVNFKKCPI